jgi:hypothetical protein
MRSCSMTSSGLAEASWGARRDRALCFPLRWSLLLLLLFLGTLLLFLPSAYGRQPAVDVLSMLGQVCYLLYYNLRSLYGWSRSRSLTAYLVTIAVVITPRLLFSPSGVPLFVLVLPGQRTYKLPSGTTSEPGRYVKSLGDPVTGSATAPSRTVATALGVRIIVRAFPTPDRSNHAEGDDRNRPGRF